MAIKESTFNLKYTHNFMEVTGYYCCELVDIAPARRVMAVVFNKKMTPSLTRPITIDDVVDMSNEALSKATVANFESLRQANMALAAIPKGLRYLIIMQGQILLATINEIVGSIHCNTACRSMVYALEIPKESKWFDRIDKYDQLGVFYKQDAKNSVFVKLTSLTNGEEAYLSLPLISAKTLTTSCGGEPLELILNKKLEQKEMLEIMGPLDRLKAVIPTAEKQEQEIETPNPAVAAILEKATVAYTPEKEQVPADAVRGNIGDVGKIIPTDGPPWNNFEAEYSKLVPTASTVGETAIPVMESTPGDGEENVFVASTKPVEPVEPEEVVEVVKAAEPSEPTEIEEPKTPVQEAEDLLASIKAHNVQGKALEATLRTLIPRIRAQSKQTASPDILNRLKESAEENKRLKADLAAAQLKIKKAEAVIHALKAFNEA